MRFAVFDSFRVGIVTEAGLHEVTALLPEAVRGNRYAMNHVVEHFDVLRPKLEQAAKTVDPVPVESVRLRPPVPVPLQLLAAPGNHQAHRAEMRASGLSVAATEREQQTPRSAGFFLKAPGSMVGPSAVIELPALPGRRFDHEGELALVIGREARAVKQAHALDHVFGYTGLIDVTLRLGADRREDRAMRKSFSTFTPVGPVLVTADEIPDCGNLDIRLWVDGELRQDANTRDFLVGVPELLEIASHILPLQPGDLYTTGSPAGVGPIRPGEEVTLEVERVGRMRLPVRERDW